jgi:hypothetical protein
MRSPTYRRECGGQSVQLVDVVGRRGGRASRTRSMTSPFLTTTVDNSDRTDWPRAIGWSPPCAFCQNTLRLTPMVPLGGGPCRSAQNPTTWRDAYAVPRGRAGARRRLRHQLASFYGYIFMHFGLSTFQFEPAWFAINIADTNVPFTTGPVLINGRYEACNPAAPRRSPASVVLSAQPCPASGSEGTTDPVSPGERCLPATEPGNAAIPLGHIMRAR